MRRHVFTPYIKNKDIRAGVHFNVKGCRLVPDVPMHPMHSDFEENVTAVMMACDMLENACMPQPYPYDDFTVCGTVPPLNRDRWVKLVLSAEKLKRYNNIACVCASNSLRVTEMLERGKAAAPCSCNKRQRGS